jgi:WS/DGAT/MGAT family acyltransferase
MARVDIVKRTTARKALAPVLEPRHLPRRMAATDALFWYAESALPIFRPIIAGLYVLDRAPDARRMAHGLENALAMIPRLRQRVLEAPLHIGLPEWVDDAHFDASYHVRHLSLPPPGSQRELLDLAATLFATPLDRERPLWETYWIDGLTGGRAAFFMKLHHSVVDGVGSIMLLNALTQDSRTALVPRVVVPPARRAAGQTPTAVRLASLSADNAVAGARLLWEAASAPARFLAQPGESVAALEATVRGMRGMIADLLAPPVRDPLADASSGLSRRFDVMQIPLARLQRMKEPLGVTINDVVLAVLAGALGAYHRERRVYVHELHCMVPMNLRGKDDRDVLGNRVGTFIVRLPLAPGPPDTRLEIVTRQTRAAKDDRRGAAGPLLLQAIALLPGFAFRWIARRSLGKVNLACTNVPGVRERRYMAGALVEALYPFASVVEGTPLVIALLSYGGVMHVGIDTDPEAIPDPQRLHALLDDGLAEMERLAFGAERTGAGRVAARRIRPPAPPRRPAGACGGPPPRAVAGGQRVRRAAPRLSTRCALPACPAGCGRRSAATCTACSTRGRRAAARGSIG